MQIAFNGFFVKLKPKNGYSLSSGKMRRKQTKTEMATLMVKYNRRFFHDGDGNGKTHLFTQRTQQHMYKR